MDFKKLDILIQVLIPVIAVLFIFTNRGLDGFLYGVVIGYSCLGAWQLISVVLHLFNKQWRLLPQSRTVYYALLVLAIPMCVFPLFALESSNFFPAMLIGAAMAIFYFTISVREYRLLKKVIKKA